MTDYLPPVGSRVTFEDGRRSAALEQYTGTIHSYYRLDDTLWVWITYTDARDVCKLCKLRAVIKFRNILAWEEEP